MVVTLRQHLQEPVAEKPPELVSLARLRVRHPGYADDNNTLFELRAHDVDEDADNANAPRWGVQYHLVHAACAVIANNRSDGILTRSRAPPSPWPPTLLATPGHVLPVDDYYYHLAPPPITAPTSSASPQLVAYPIVPNFREWRFPEYSPWVTTAAPIPQLTEPPCDVVIRDRSCRLTNYSEASEIAHIIPVSEIAWYGRNTMDRYSTSTKVGTDAIATPENMITMRGDIHFLWDKSFFSVVPKMSAVDTRWAIHVHKPSQELYSLYHNRALQPLAGVRHEYLFARFAWDIFPLLRGFFQRGKQRRVVYWDGHEEWADNTQCQRFCMDQGRGRSSTSPRKSPKRKHSQGQSSEGRKDGPDDAQSDMERRSFDLGVHINKSSWSSPGSDGDNKEAGEVETEGDDSSNSDGDDSDGDDDPYGYKRRAEQRRLEREIANPDPYGLKRRMQQDSFEEENERGRKRTKM